MMGAVVVGAVLGVLVGVLGALRDWAAGQRVAVMIAVATLYAVALALRNG